MKNNKCVKTNVVDQELLKASNIRVAELMKGLEMKGSHTPPSYSKNTPESFVPGVNEPVRNGGK